MTRWMIQFTLLMGSVALTSAVAADEAGDVKAATEGWISALNAANVSALLPYYQSEETSFGGLGDLLTEGVHTKEFMTAFFESGFKTDLQWRHLKVKVFGKAAVVTGYLAGAVTLPGGTVLEDSWRTSVMWVQEEGSWKIVHFHASYLLPK